MPAHIALGMVEQMLREQHEADVVDELLDPESYDPDLRRDDQLAAIIRAGGEVIQP